MANGNGAFLSPAPRGRLQPLRQQPFPPAVAAQRGGGRAKRDLERWPSGKLAFYVMDAFGQLQMVPEGQKLRRGVQRFVFDFTAGVYLEYERRRRRTNPFNHRAAARAARRLRMTAKACRMIERTVRKALRGAGVRPR